MGRAALGRGLMPLLALSILLGACTTPGPNSGRWQARESACSESNTVHAEVVAFEQAYVLNRFGAYVPAGLMYALKSDVQALDAERAIGPGNVQLRSDKRPRPLVLRVHERSCLQVTLHNWLTPQWVEEGGQPPEPRLLVDGRWLPAAPAHLVDAAGIPTSRRLKPLAKTPTDAPRTRHVSFTVTGLEPTPPHRCPRNAVCGGDGTYVGLDGHQGQFFHPDTAPEVREQYRSGTVIAPGQVSVTQWLAHHEGSFFAHSMGAPVGGEGDGGQIGLGLFAAVNVEPADSSWYRSQATHAELAAAKQPMPEGDHHPYAALDYERFALMGGAGGRQLLHSDLNAIIVRGPKAMQACERMRGQTEMDGQRCEPAFREFTVILHDEVHAVQAFPELDDPDHPMHYVKDGMGINYGVSSMGSTAMAAMPQRGVGPARACPECRAEEFFLSSFANGDPALVLQWQDGLPVAARYPDDPSNVHHSYLGDPVVFRNLHAGPKETHVFHLHAHQWVLDGSDPNSTYLDSQTISPGATFSYGIEFGGSGNRNLTVGDSIFHCHLYPHFAQGMWELWRVHDVFESGLLMGMFDPAQPTSATNDPQSRSLPDGEIAAGVASPALLPLPGKPLAPMPSAQFRGYPFYIAGEPGHRPPQPPLDFDVDAKLDPSYADDYTRKPRPEAVTDGGLPRHVVRSGRLDMLRDLKPGTPAFEETRKRALDKGGEAARLIARKVEQDSSSAFGALAGDWAELQLSILPHQGTPAERSAMSFHEGTLSVAAPLAQGGLQPSSPPPASAASAWWPSAKGYRTGYAGLVPGMAAPQGPARFLVNGRGRAPGAPFANPCPAEAPVRDYYAAFIQTEMTVNRHGWFDPQGRLIVLENDLKDIIDADRRVKLPEPLFFRANSGDCIRFRTSNFVPSALNADDFQIYTPTDTIGQHIHLVKFDVTSSDGSGNGFNYEDGSLSPDEVRDRIFAYNRGVSAAERLRPKAHPLFAEAGSLRAAAAADAGLADLLKRGSCPPQGAMSDAAYARLLEREHPYCGAQRSTQRWWADPIIVRSGKSRDKDNTLRTVFTHDHFGPSSHQQHGLYAALVVEPSNSVWRAQVDAGQLKAACDSAAATHAALGAAPVADGLGAQDRYIAQSFAVLRVLASGAAPTQRATAEASARACLLVATLGGADLTAKPTVDGQTPPGTAPASLIALQPRPPLLNREDGGPTSTRASIVSPACIGQPDSHPYLSAQAPACAQDEQGLPRAAEQTRREYALAFADFAPVYDLGLEPINPETARDVSMRRFGERQVVRSPAKPLVISSEDPGTQLINYRQEPIALRVADVAIDEEQGGLSYQQSDRAADGGPCAAGRLDCQGDMANAFSSAAHRERDRALATQRYVDWLAAAKTIKAKERAEAEKAGVPAAKANAPSEMDLVSKRQKSLLEPKALGSVVKKAERWRQAFNCALTAPEQWRPGLIDSSDSDPLISVRPGEPKNSTPVYLLSQEQVFAQHCRQLWADMGRSPSDIDALRVAEPWRVFGDPATPILATLEGDAMQIRLIQGAQEAQHVFTMNGLKWLRIPDSRNSGYVNAQPLGISEHFEFDVHVPDLGVDRAHADYLYFGSSVDQLWEGLWGTLRAFGRPTNPSAAAKTVATATPPAQQLASLPTALPAPVPGTGGQIGVCTAGRAPDEIVNVHSFDVSAVRVCEVLGNCGSAEAGINYSSRYGIRDPHAVIYVLGEEASCPMPSKSVTSNGCFTANPDPALGMRLPKERRQSWDDLRADFVQGRRKVQPLVLRASAGECITVTLRNALQNRDNLAKPLPESEAAFNFLPMITDGFNLNQFAMSSTVGLSAPRVAQNPIFADGSNVGLNEEVLASTKLLAAMQGSAGSLVPMCGSGKAPCSTQLVWSANDLRRDPRDATRLIQVPVELGALPLRSFGDVVKHTTHGLVGALIIGDVGIQACADKDRGAVSARMCDANGDFRYSDHVLVMQDAVSAQRGGYAVADLSGAEEPDDYGVKAINYGTEPLWARVGGSPSIGFSERNAAFDFSQAFSSARADKGCVAGMPAVGQGVGACDPLTRVIVAAPSEQLRLHFVHPGGHTRQQGLTVAGHGFWPFPFKQESQKIDEKRCQGPMPGEGCRLWQGVFNGFGPMMAVTLPLTAGGAAHMPKDYLIRSNASFLLDGGLWGILRVTEETPEMRATAR